LARLLLLHTPKSLYPTISRDFVHIKQIALNEELFQYSFSNTQKKKVHSDIVYLFALIYLWAQLGSNQRPPDYESGNTEQPSYGPNNQLFHFF
jgi:hypothetical protein